MKKHLSGLLAACMLLLCSCAAPGETPRQSDALPAETAAPSPAAAPTPAPEPSAAPSPEPAPEPEARQLAYAVSGVKGNKRALYDGRETSAIDMGRGCVFTLTASEPIGGLYILWDEAPLPWEVTVGASAAAGGENGFRHEYLALPESAETVTIRLSDERSVRIGEICAFSPGRPPDWVQLWQPPCEKADLLVIPTHADDEFIFFGGLLPLYAGERGLSVQVIYMIDHQGRTRARHHELLNGLWQAGVRHYPVIHDAQEFRVTNREQAESYYKDGFFRFQVEMIRRFKPRVIVGHDVEGEYHNPLHIFNAKNLMKAVESACDEDCEPDSAERWGLWDTPKTYLHLYGPAEERTVLDYETPLEAFGGKTAFEVAEEAYALHKSQQHLHFRVYGFDSGFDSHSFGLYRSLVGPDTARNDLMENLGE